jgi:hypothetical protein
MEKPEDRTGVRSVRELGLLLEQGRGGEQQLGEKSGVGIMAET